MRLICLTLLASLVLAASAHAETSPRALIEGYCVTCHNEQAKRGGLVLDPSAADRPEQQPELWEKVVRKLRGGTMPPLGTRRPEQSQIASAVASLERGLDYAAQKNPNPGR